MNAAATALDILIAARAKIAEPEDWGKGVPDTREYAETFCAIEAIDVSASCGTERTRAKRALHAAAGVAYHIGWLCDWNDAPERTHAEVLAAFDCAIATLRQP